MTRRQGLDEPKTILPQWWTRNWQVTHCMHCSWWFNLTISLPLFLPPSLLASIHRPLCVGVWRVVVECVCVCARANMCMGVPVSMWRPGHDGGHLLQQLFLFKIIYFALCVQVFCLHVYVHYVCVWYLWKSEEELGLWIGVERRVGAGNWTWVRCRTNRSYWLLLLTSEPFYFTLFTKGKSL